jgi:hypothetical protein
MIYSIYHFFKSLEQNRQRLRDVEKLEDFPFDENLLSCKRKGQFPDLAIKINRNDALFTGGELIELKDSKSYSVSSFNSTIPTGRKEIAKVVRSSGSDVYNQMIAAGDCIFSLPLRDVFYLIRGKRKGHCKVALVHGSFFETVNVSDLITKSFAQVFEERLKQSRASFDEETKNALAALFSEQENFSRVRNVDQASVKLRFRIMTEVKAEGNILNSRKYPEIADDTLNFVLPYHSEQDEKDASMRMSAVFNGLTAFRIFRIKHHFNGYFLVFQCNL